MAKSLRELYPFIRERQEILQEIMDTPDFRETFLSWTEENQNYFLDFCSGARGVKMLYDGFFKELFNPDTKPHRLEELLSLLMQQKVRILHVLPNDSSRIAEESSLLIMDIVVQLENGSIANVECQRIGYRFAGQRAACYSADLLLRQYKRIRDKKKKTFSYKDVKNVYSIIFYEKSPEAFQQYSEDSIHRFHQVSDTGLKLDLLQEFIFIPLG
ncbi:MAG: PD-(D/E)XK nuclease family transposase [Agathobacter sp.]